MANSGTVCIPDFQAFNFLLETDESAYVPLQLIRSLMDTAVATGLNVVRAWGHSVSPEYALQTAPGQYSEAIFRGLDYAVEQARRRGIKASFSVSSSQGVTVMLFHTFHIFPAPRQGALADRLHIKAAQIVDEDFVEFPI